LKACFDNNEQSRCHKTFPNRSAEREALRQEYAKPIFGDLEVCIKDQLGKISGKTSLALSDDPAPQTLTLTTSTLTAMECFLCEMQ
jgi:hypothetical protein|tara:strand:+ start:273 stop:530 length:258 start_codon:yes stop_codon:yes gene_type:complete